MKIETAGNQAHQMFTVRANALDATAREVGAVVGEPPARVFGPSRKGSYAAAGEDFINGVGIFPYFWTFRHDAANYERNWLSSADGP